MAAVPLPANGDTSWSDWATYIHAKLATTVSVKDYGALGDGTTNDSAAFTAALATGKPVWVPPSTGAYRMGSRVTVPTGAEICGAGEKSVISGPAFRLGSRSRISGLAFTGTTTGTGAIDTINTSEPSDSTVDHCLFVGVDIGVELRSTADDSGPTRFRVVNNRFNNCTLHSVFAARAFDCLVADNVSVQPVASGQHVSFFGGSRNRVAGNTTWRGITGVSFIYNRTAAGPTGCIYGNIVEGNAVHSPSEEGISFDVRGNEPADIAVLDIGTVSAAATSGTSLDITLSEAAYATSGSAFFNYFLCFVTGALAGHLFRIDSHTGADFHVLNAAAFAPEIAAGNEVVIGAALTANVIRGNTVRHAGSGGIVLWGLCYGNVVQGNTLEGAGTTQTILTPVAVPMPSGGIEVSSLNGLTVSTASVTGANGRGPSMSNLISGNTLWRAGIRCGYAQYGSGTYMSVGNRVVDNTCFAGAITSDQHTVTYRGNRASPALSAVGATA